MGRQENRNFAKKNGLDQKALSNAIHTAQTETRKATVHFYSVAVLSVLADKNGFDKEQLQKVSADIQERFDCVLKDYATLQDYEKILNEEYDLVIKEK